MAYRSNKAKIVKALKLGAKEGMSNVGDRIVELAIQFCPVGQKNGGNLQQSIDHDNPKIQNDKVTMEYGAYSPYAAPVEYGSASEGEPLGSTYRSPVGASDWPSVPPGKKTSQPYKIRAKNRKTLRWENANGDESFKREVTHPGVKAQPFMRPAVDIVRHREASTLIGEAIARRLRIATGGEGS